MQQLKGNDLDIRRYYFVIEGPDGCGKSTLIKELVNYFNNYTSFNAFSITPSNNPYGKAVKTLLKSLQPEDIDISVEKRLQLSTLINMMKVDVERLLDTPLKPNTDKVIIFIDRWLHSTAVYQHYVPNHHVVGGIPEITVEEDLVKYNNFINRTFLLDAPDDVLDKRLGKRDEKDKYEESTFQQKVREGYRKFTTYRGGLSNRLTVIDVSHEDKEQNFKRLLSEVTRCL